VEFLFLEQASQLLGLRGMRTGERCAVGTAKP